MTENTETWGGVARLSVVADRCQINIRIANSRSETCIVAELNGDESKWPHQRVARQLQSSGNLPGMEIVRWHPLTVTAFLKWMFTILP